MRSQIGIGIRIISAGLCLGAGFVFGYQSTAKAEAEKIFGNLTYFTSCPYIAESVTLVNGEQAVWRGPGDVSLFYEGHYVYGDFNWDGRKDAAVVIGQSEGGSDDGRLLAFLINQDGRLVHKQSVHLGDSAIINSFRERGGKVIIDMFIHQEGDCQAGPTKRVKRIYDYLNPDSGDTIFPTKTAQSSRNQTKKC